MKRLLAMVRGAWFATAFVIAAWLALMITHEAGHVIHALLSGGRVDRVVIPLVGFSRTDLAHNPHPVFVAWGGFVWGALIPAAMLGLANLLWLRASRPFRGFAAVALLANGAYACSRAGDVEDILRAGGWRWPLVVYGILLILPGLFLLERFIKATPLPAVSGVSGVWLIAVSALAAGMILLALGISGIPW